jgi:predicted secreted Zn-dependent protease
MKIITAFLILFSLAANAQETRNLITQDPFVEVDYYTIRGASAAELNAEMDRKGPGEFYGRTDYHYRWKCDDKSYSVTYDVKVILPTWKMPKNADPQLVTRWNNFIRSLTIHENGHVQIGLNKKNKIIEILKTTNCQSAKSIINDMEREMKSQDREYDEQTNHGKNLGSIL